MSCSSDNDPDLIFLPSCQENCESLSLVHIGRQRRAVLRNMLHRSFYYWIWKFRLRLSTTYALCSGKTFQFCHFVNPSLKKVSIWKILKVVLINNAIKQMRRKKKVKQVFSDFTVFEKDVKIFQFTRLVAKNNRQKIFWSKTKSSFLALKFKCPTIYSVFLFANTVNCKSKCIVWILYCSPQPNKFLSRGLQLWKYVESTVYKCTVQTLFSYPFWFFISWRTEWK